MVLYVAIVCILCSYDGNKFANVFAENKEDELQEIPHRIQFLDILGGDVGIATMACSSNFDYCIHLDIVYQMAQKPSQQRSGLIKRLFNCYHDNICKHHRARTPHIVVCGLCIYIAHVAATNDVLDALLRC